MVGLRLGWVVDLPWVGAGAGVVVAVGVVGRGWAVVAVPGAACGAPGRAVDAVVPRVAAPVCGTVVAAGASGDAGGLVGVGCTRAAPPGRKGASTLGPPRMLLASRAR
ncbi:hypothetical protein GCM10025734_04790 [Kitasatospora paranensis]